MADKPNVGKMALIEIHDALAICKATVDTAAQALLFDRQQTRHVAVVLDENVSRPLERQRARIGQIMSHFAQGKRHKKAVANPSRRLPKPKERGEKR